MKQLALCVAILISISLVHAQPGLIDLQRQLSTSKTDTAKARALYRIALHWSKENPDSAKLYAQRSLALFTSANYNRGIADIQLVIAKIQANTNQPSLALRHYKLALSLYTDMRDIAGQAACYSGMGVALGMQEKFPLALTNLYTALKLYQQTGNTDGASNTFMKIGVVHNRTNDLPAALKSYNEALALAERSGNVTSQAGIQVNIGSLYGQMHLLDKSLSALTASKTLATKVQMLPIIAEADMNIGNVYRELSSFDSAQHYYSLAEKEFSQLENKESLSRTYSAIAEMHFNKKEFAKAKASAEKSMTIANEIGNKALLYDDYDLLADISKAENNYTSTATYYAKMLALKDSLFQERSNEQLQRLKAEFQQEKDEQIIEKLTGENELKTKQRNLLVFAICFVVLLLLLLFITLRMIYKKNRQLEKRKQELLEMNKMKDKFLSIIGHDMRSPLANIVQLLHVFTYEQLSEMDSRNLFTKLLLSTNAVLETMDNMLLWGRNYFTKGVSEKKPVDMQELADRVCRFLNQSAENKNIHIQNNITAPIRIMADENQVEFVLRNLISNAVKFSHESSKIELTAETVDGFVHFGVKDYGTGMHEQQQLQLFDLSKRESTKGTAGEKGSGLGLLLSQEFISMHGGSLKVDSAEGKGTEFIVMLPCA